MHTVCDEVLLISGPDAGETAVHSLGGHDAAIDSAVPVRLSVCGLENAVLEGLLKAAAGLRGDAGTRLNLGSVGEAEDAVIKGIAQII